MENKKIYKSWYTMVKENALSKGVLIKGVVHKAVPVLDGTKALKAICLKCGSNNGYVFESVKDSKIRIVFCLKCNKYSWLDVDNKPSTSVVAPPVKKAELLAEHVQKATALEQARCIALTTKGIRCSKKGTTAEGLCSYHKTSKILGKEVKIVPDNVF